MPSRRISAVHADQLVMTEDYVHVGENLLYHYLDSGFHEQTADGVEYFVVFEKVDAEGCNIDGKLHWFTYEVAADEEYYSLREESEVEVLEVVAREITKVVYDKV